MERDTAPPYTPSPPSPRYSTELLPGEQTVELTRRALSRSPTGGYRRITDNLTIVLRDQQRGSINPVYGRNGLIQGDLILRNTGDLTSVTLKIEGQFLLETSAVPVSVTFFSATFVLWSATQGAQRCPQTIPFGVILPLTFDDGGQARPLPPTFESTEVRAACSYSLTVGLSRPRQFLSFLKGNEAVKVPFIYRPRSRPHMPMLPSDMPFMSTVKTSPEEWHEVMCTVAMTHGSGLEPLQCLLFIPSVRVYALSGTIPFHLQIRGSSASLLPFLEQEQGSARGATGRSSVGMDIRIYLLREIGATIYGQSATSTHVVGEGKIDPSQCLPSKHHAFLRHPLGEGLDSLDWDGELRCGEDVTVPGFFTNQLFVKDFIVLSIVPRQPLKSPLLAVRHFHPIRFVTDPWSNVVIR